MTSGAQEEGKLALASHKEGMDTSFSERINIQGAF